MKQKLDELREKTACVRGYIAIRDWDSSLYTIEAGDNTDVFIQLSENEGVCGYVLQTGKEINIKNTRIPPNLIHQGEPRFHYISSDSKIRSEFVCPFEKDGSVFAILNLESHHENNFRKRRREQILGARDEIARLVEEYRRPLDRNILGSEFILGRAMQDLSNPLVSLQARSFSRIIAETAETLFDELKQLFPHTRLHGPFLSEQSLGNEFTHYAHWQDRHASKHWEVNGKWFYCCDIRRDGLRQAVIVVEEDSLLPKSALDCLQRLSRLAALRLTNFLSANSQYAKMQ